MGRLNMEEKISFYYIKTFVDLLWKYRIYRRIERPPLIIEPLYDVDTQEEAMQEIERLEKENERIS